MLASLLHTADIPTLEFSHEGCKFAYRQSLQGGVFKDAYLYCEKSNEALYVLTVPKENAPKSDEMRELGTIQKIEELKTQGRLFPHVLTVTALTLNQKICFLSSYGSFGNLEQYRTVHPLSVHTLLHIAKESTSALSEIHQAMILHRDLKPDNFLVFPEDLIKPAIKLTDFGKSILLGKGDEDMPDTLLPSAFVAPERAVPGYTEALPSDVFQLGVTFYLLTTGIPLQKNPLNRESIEMKFGYPVENELRRSWSEYKKMSGSWPGSEDVVRQIPEIAALYLKMTDSNPTNRPIATSVLHALKAIDLSKYGEDFFVKIQEHKSSQPISLGYDT